MTKFAAAALFAITIAAIAVMWESAFWATALAEVALFCVAAFWIIAALIGVAELQTRFVLFPLAAAALWPLVQIVAGTTIYRWATAVSLLYWASAAALVFAGLQIFSDHAVRRGYLRALVVAGFIMAVVAPLQLFTSGGKIFWLFETPFANVAMGPFLYGNQYAAFIELLLPVAMASLFTDRGGWRIFYGLAAAVMYASVFASVSRTGFILTTIEVLLVPLVAARRAGISFRQIAGPGVIFLAVLMVLGLAVGPERMIAKLQQKDPYAGRREFAEAALPMIQDRPWMGVGLGNWSVAYPQYAIFDEGLLVNQAHNDWAQWTVEGGVPFVLFMLLVAVWSFRAAFRTIWGTGVLVVFFQCFVDYPIQRIAVAIVFFTLISAIAFPEVSSEAAHRRSGMRRKIDSAA